MGGESPHPSRFVYPSNPVSRSGSGSRAANGNGSRPESRAGLAANAVPLGALERSEGVEMERDDEKSGSGSGDRNWDRGRSYAWMNGNKGWRGRWRGRA